MAHEVLLPQWSMGMQDGQITRWLKQSGDTVADGEVIAEVESSKVASELLADRDGVFLRALVAVDELVPVRTALCLIGTADELTEDAPARLSATPRPSTASADRRPAPPPAPGVQITPRARKLAVDHGIDLAAVRGSGPGGRIRAADVPQFALPQADATPPVAAAGDLAATAAGGVRSLPPSASAVPPSTVAPMSKARRRRVARATTGSSSSSPTTSTTTNTSPSSAE